MVNDERQASDVLRHKNKRYGREGQGSAHCYPALEIIGHLTVIGETSVRRHYK
jgi:hypothetical protein